MSRNVFTHIVCDRCHTTVHVPCKQSILTGSFKKMGYPESWHSVEDDMLCPSCSKEFNDVYMVFKNKKNNIGGEKKVV